MAMDQKELRQWEARCIQEEMPRCTAACPLHVDARAVCGHVAEGRVNDAWAVLVRTMPLPSVLARICDGPCRTACLRGEFGGGIDVAALERFCARAATKSPRMAPLPRRKGNAAVLGGGFAGLCAAWDLARKGFSVTLYGPRPAGRLAAPTDADGELAAALAHELETMAKLGVRFEDGAAPGVAADDAAGAARWLSDRSAPGDAGPDAAPDTFDAVFADPEAVPAALHGLGPADPVSLGTLAPGVFSGDTGSGVPASPVALAALGRRAAASVERFAQKASLTAGREHEGPVPTRLYTNPAGIERAAPAPEPEGGHTEETAAREAARCLNCQCLESVKNCAYLAHYGAYPKVYARRIYNNASIVMGTRHANEMINSCMLCGLCTELCPTNFDMAGLCLMARRDMVQRGKMPPSAHEFALRDMAFANGPSCALARPAPDGGRTELLFFPGCQLTASDPGGAEAAYAALRAARPGVGLLLRCCGAPARWAGREDLFAESLEALRTDWRALDAPPIATACPTCAATLRQALPEAEILPVWGLLGAAKTGEATESIAEGAGTAKSSGIAGAGAPLAVHDPCAARHDEPARTAGRGLLAGLGVATVEPRLTGKHTECCGFGGLLAEANPPLAAKAAARRAAAADQDFVTYCAMCRDMLARAGKRALHVFDLLYPRHADPAARPAPGHSERRENRARLKDRLLRELWREPGAEPAPHEAVRVRCTEEAAQRMEERRILISDVQKTLLHARESGAALVRADATSGRRLAAYRPVSVTYWVDYEPEGDGFLVHNAWSHRMRILGLDGREGRGASTAGDGPRTYGIGARASDQRGNE
jgi:Fe-S oxidoreductase